MPRGRSRSRGASPEGSSRGSSPSPSPSPSRPVPVAVAPLVDASFVLESPNWARLRNASSPETFSTLLSGGAPPRRSSLTFASAARCPSRIRRLASRASASSSSARRRSRARTASSYEFGRKGSYSSSTSALSVPHASATGSGLGSGASTGLAGSAEGATSPVVLVGPVGVRAEACSLSRASFACCARSAAACALSICGLSIVAGFRGGARSLLPAPDQLPTVPSDFTSFPGVFASPVDPLSLAVGRSPNRPIARNSATTSTRGGHPVRPFRRDARLEYSARW